MLECRHELGPRAACNICETRLLKDRVTGRPRLASRGYTLEASVRTAKLPPNRTPTPGWSDEELVEECLRGNQAAWSAVVDKYKNLVYSAPLKYRLSPQDAADIFQDVWVDLYAELKNLRKPGALGSWLVSVASNKCFQWKRRHARKREQQPSAADREPVAHDPLFPEWKEQAERSQMLRDAIAQLPERCQTMVRLLFYRTPPLPYANVARQLGVAEGSIGFLRGRCLEKLRKSLEARGF
jgi:RNA polymerase sigma factor (sigma-70 family)